MKTKNRVNKKQTIIIAKSVLIAAHNPDNKYLVCIGLPEQISESEWRCSFEIKGKRGIKLKYAYGLDAIQSLIVAFQGIRNAINKLPKVVTWEGNPVEMAFPLFVPCYGEVKFTRKIENLIDKQLKLNLMKAKRKSVEKIKRK